MSFFGKLINNGVNDILSTIGTVGDFLLSKTRDWNGDTVSSLPSNSSPVSNSANGVTTLPAKKVPNDVGEDLGPNLSDGTTYPDNVASNLFDVNSYFNEALNLARAEQDFNAKEANIARSFNAEEAEKARNFSSSEAALNRSFNAQQALEQREFEERMASTQYQRAIQDMQAAGLNPYLVYSQGGNAVPSGAVASGSAAASSMASGMSAQATNFSSTYLNALTKLTAQMMNFTSQISGSAMKLVGALL